MEQRASVSVALVLALTLCFLQCGFSNEHCTTCEQNRECAKQDSSECDYADSWEPEARESSTLWDAYKGIYQDTLSYHKFMMTIALLTVIAIITIILFFRMKEKEIEAKEKETMSRNYQVAMQTQREEHTRQLKAIEQKNEAREKKQNEGCRVS